VLAEGLNGQTTVARFHGLLNLLFKKPRGQALAVTLSPLY
jgi:hypothetical protein